MSINYYLENGKIVLARYIVSYVKFDSNYGTNTAVTALFKNTSEYTKYINDLTAKDITYEVKTVTEEELAPYLQYEGVEVVNTDEAGKLLNPEPQALLEYKIDQMNSACREAIVAGLDIGLSDGSTRHFSMTDEDQINILGLTIQAASGIFNDTGVPYHADNEECEIYSLADFNIIATKCFAWKTYNTTYVNQIKSYLRKLAEEKDLIRMHTATYGMELPQEYTDKIESLLKVIQVKAVL